METQYELYKRLEKETDHESRKLLFDLKMNTLNEMCTKYGKRREDIAAYTQFIHSIVEFYLKTGFLTEKQLKAFKAWKNLTVHRGYDNQMSDLDLAFWGANDFGSQ
jgi:hypothetical protein